jgi:hypothetical protein
MATGQSDVARPADDDPVDFDLRSAMDQLGEDTGYVAATMDRRSIRRYQATLTREACGCAPKVSPAERRGERRQGTLHLLAPVRLHRRAFVVDHCASHSEGTCSNQRSFASNCAARDKRRGSLSAGPACSESLHMLLTKDLINDS